MALITSPIPTISMIIPHTIFFISLCLSFLSFPAAGRTPADPGHRRWRIHRFLISNKRFRRERATVIGNAHAEREYSLLWWLQVLFFAGPLHHRGGPQHHHRIPLPSLFSFASPLSDIGQVFLYHRYYHKPCHNSLHQVCLFSLLYSRWRSGPTAP